MKKWYEALFENYAHKYDKECFVQGTIGECDFIEKEIDHDKSLKIIDIGCGTGRHAIELTKRGYNVTGVDLSKSQIKRAREKAQEAGANIDCRIVVGVRPRNLHHHVEDAALANRPGQLPGISSFSTVIETFSAG